MAVILNPSTAAKTAPLEKTFDSLDRGLRGLGLQNLDHHFAHA